MRLRIGTPGEAGMSPQRVRHLAELARGWVEQGITPALVVLVARRGVIVLHEAFGRLGPEPDAPALQRDSLFPLCSLSKPITATAAMILVEEGLLGLNRPVQWYLPEFVGQGKEQVCVHHLLTHTSGIRDEDLRAYVEKKRGSVEIPPSPKTQHSLVHGYLYLRYDAPLWKAPGTEMSYCNLNYELLGEIVRRVSGQSLADFTRERIFQPLGMADTCWVMPDDLKPRLVRRAGDDPGTDLLAQLRVGEVPWACGGVCSTALEMAIFGQMFLNRGAYGEARVLSSATVSAMTRNQIPGISATHDGQFFPEASWGLGWGVHGPKKCLADGEALSSAELVSHGGLGGTFVWVDPACEMVGVYFSVHSKGGTPAGVNVSQEGQMGWRSDLFVNAATAAVVD